MTRADLEARIRSTVSRYTRSIADSSGTPVGLVDELANIAEEHAAEAAAPAAARRKPRTTDH